MRARELAAAVGRMLYVVLAGLLYLRFLFLLPLATNVSYVGTALFFAATALIVPASRRQIARLSGLERRWLRALVFVVLLVAASGLQQLGDRADVVHGDYAFIGAHVINGEREAAIVRDAVVLVNRAGRIVAVGPRDSVKVPDGYEEIDVAGRYMVPGLINAHAHLMLTGRPPGEPAQLGRYAISDAVGKLILSLLKTWPGEQFQLSIMKKNALRALRGGVTTVRGLGDANWMDVRLRDMIDDGHLLGPRILASGPIICVTGGHAHQIGQVVDGPIEARRAVRNALAHRVDHIKIASTGGVSDSRRLGEAGEPQMTPAEIAAVTDEAHRKNMLVAAHAESPRGVLEALRAGVDNIEHGASLDKEAVALFLNNPRSLRGYTTLHPTLSVLAGPLVLTDVLDADPRLQIMYANAKQVKEEMYSGFETAIARGVKIGVGTDAGIVSHDAVWREMTYFVEHGDIPNELALHIGTLGTAESIGLDKRTGSIEVGKSADLLIIDGNPHVDLAALGRPVLVVTRGVIVEP
jgi:imidazolonepropionase-like amidohydrolase